MQTFDKTRVWVTTNLSFGKLLGVESEKAIIFDNDRLKCVSVFVNYFRMVNGVANTTKKRKTRTTKKTKKPKKSKKSKKEPKEGKKEKSNDDDDDVDVDDVDVDDEKAMMLAEKSKSTKKYKKAKKLKKINVNEFMTDKLTSTQRKYTLAEKKKRNDVMISFGKINHLLIQGLFEDRPVEIIQSMNCMLTFFCKKN
jgi:hypothetical protein